MHDGKISGWVCPSDHRIRETSADTELSNTEGAHMQYAKHTGSHNVFKITLNKIGHVKSENMTIHLKREITFKHFGYFL